MIKKEDLYKEYVLVKNELNTLLGKPLFVSGDLDEYFSSRKFRDALILNTKESISYMLECAKEDLETEKYYKTDEGKKEKEELSNKITLAIISRRDFILDCRKKVDDFIKSWLGNNWGVGSFGNYSMDIGLVEKVEDGENRLYFGYGFSVTYGNDISMLSMNYGTTGSFRVFSESDLHDVYLLGMAKFTNDKDKLKELYEINKIKELSNINTYIDDLNYNLKYPLKKRKIRFSYEKNQ